MLLFDAPHMPGWVGEGGTPWGHGLAISASAEVVRYTPCPLRHRDIYLVKSRPAMLERRTAWFMVYLPRVRLRANVLVQGGGSPLVDWHGVGHPRPNVHGYPGEPA